MTDIRVPAAAGELIDKLTILQLKVEKISDPDKLINVRKEQASLQAVADQCLIRSPDLDALWAELYQTNCDLWALEDRVRTFEADQDFGAAFVAAARAIYAGNDARARIKKRINLLLGSAIVEEKSYQSKDPT